jgi:hypothetical protein
MAFATPFRLLRVRLLSLLMVASGLASSCQSSRPSFSFQPMERQPPTAKKATIAPKAPVAAVVVEVPTASTPPPRLKTELTRKKAGYKRPGPHWASVAAEGANVIAITQAPKSVHKRAFLRRPQAPAEAGLGTTVLGVLGLVILPIALIGLALSGGGLVWGIVAGAAALAVLVAYIDPFGR